jgi:hypothetical protein
MRLTFWVAYVSSVRIQRCESTSRTERAIAS